MKTVIRLILIVLLIGTMCSFVACGKTEPIQAGQQPQEEPTQPQSKEIELTDENYDDYLEVKLSHRYKSQIERVATISVAGNSHYKYKDVALSIQIIWFGDNLAGAEKKKAFQDWEFKNRLARFTEEDPGEMPDVNKKTVTVKLNLAGSGTETVSLLESYFSSTLEGSVYFYFDHISGTVEEY